MTGFAHDIAGGSGKLVVTQVQSPNFVHGSTGWRIAKDGSAEFHSVILPSGSGGATIYFASSAPASPNVGDLWYNTAAGLEVSQWNGSAWVAYQIGTGAIANSSITNSLLNASVTARSIGGITTTIAGTAPASPVAGDIWIDSAAGYQLSQWNGTSWVAITWTATNVISAGTISGSLIQANTITASLLAAGIIYAGIVNGTTITGAQLIADGTSGNVLAFTGTPSSSNLLASISPASGTYAGAGYIPGIGVYSGLNNPYIQLYVEGTSPNQLPVILLYPNRTNDNPASITLDIGNIGLANEYVETYWNGPTVNQQTDGARIRQYSSSQDKTIPAAGDLAYHDAAGTDHTYLSWSAAGTQLIGTVQGVSPSTGTVATPATAAGWVSVGLGASWTNRGGSFPPFRVKRLAENNMLMINGQMSAGTKTDGTKIATFGTGYIPSMIQQVNVTATQGGSGTFSPLFEIDTSGNVFCYGCGSATFVSVNAMIPLD